ncbi:hypothetical protein RDI58_001211 [Solanum bulbocastanum]|uniref:Uncharacterized protein n=1 Tax=Solanum bulbocastanum TaxID=147425 RepID=A0AAN8UDM0_SOLBU
MSTMVGEVEDPGKTISKALFYAPPLAVSANIFFRLFGKGIVPLHRGLWIDGYFSNIDKIIGGVCQKGNSSSLLPASTQDASLASSTPSISRSNIGVSVPASLSMIISTTTHACSKTQNTRDIREYDAFHRLIITTDEDGLRHHILARTKWQPCYENKINSIFEKNARIQVTKMLFEARKDNEKPSWQREHIQVGFQRGLDGWRQTQPTSEVDSITQQTSNDITSIWTNVARGVKKGRVYGHGALPSSFHPSPLLSGASTSQTLEVMEAMRREISKLTDQLQTFEANYAKAQKFMEKHMAESDDGEEKTDSDGE